MNLWRWYRARRWWLQLILALILAPAGIVAFYVAGRSLQYASAETEAGAYVPSTANVVLRARHLEDHLHRIQETAGWRALDRKFLRDPILRRELNGLLKSNGAPTLDDLEDERKPYARNLPRAVHALGLDVVATLQVKASLAQAPFCAIARLRWLHYLAAPFARLALPSESLGGETCLVLRSDSGPFYLSFEGAFAIVSNDRSLLAEALRRKGREEEGEHPIELRARFEGSPGMLAIRKSFQESGALPYVKWESARGVTAWADLRESDLFLQAHLDGAEPLYPSAPPLSVRSWAPVATSGWLVTNTGATDLIAWIRALIGVPGPADAARQTAQQALQELDEAGLSSKLLPQTRDGMTVLFGVEERAGRAYSGVSLVLPSPAPKAAVEAMNALVRKMAGSWADSSFFEPFQVGEVTGYSWRWPNNIVGMNDLLRPTYAAVGDMFILGNNQAFTEEVIRTAAQGDGFEETSNFRKFRSRLKELGFTLSPGLAGGFLFPPLLRESLDGVLSQIAKQMVAASVNTASLRAEVETDLRRQKRPLSDAEINRAYLAAFDQKILDQETALRRMLQPIDSIRWVVFEAGAEPKGIWVRGALELR